MSLAAARALLAALGLLALHVMMLPIRPEAGGAAMPDLLFCLVLACAWRRPAVAPLPLVLALGLAADILLARPPGLGALALLLGAEAMRRARGRNPLGEWLRAVLLHGAALAATALLVVLTLGPFPDGEALLRHWLVTAAVYPAAALVAHLMLRPRHEARP